MPNTLILYTFPNSRSYETFNIDNLVYVKIIPRSILFNNYNNNDLPIRFALKTQKACFHSLDDSLIY